MAKICILGGGFIGRFYAESLCGRRSKDHVTVVYSRKEATAKRFAKDYNVPHFCTEMEEAIAHEAAEFIVIALPNYLHDTKRPFCAQNP
jgi:predicted dehydrogenase